MFNIKFKSLASSSAGNAYILEGYETKILIECGLSFNKLLNKLDGKFMDIDACLISHEHKDHCKCPKELASKGVNVFGLKETLEKNGESINYSFIEVEKRFEGSPVPVTYKAFQVKEFLIKPIWVDHGDTPSVGYLIKSSLSGEKLVFIIDTFYCPYQFDGITHYVMEANYSEKLLREDQKGAKVYIDRLWGSHFSIERLCSFFDTQISMNKFKRDAKIWLTHGSKDNSDPVLFQNMIYKKTGVIPVICEP